MMNQGDHFSRFCTAIVKQSGENDECFEDLKAYHAPIECHGDVAKTIEQEWEELFSMWQMDPKLFSQELDGRLSAKAKYEFESLIDSHWYFETANREAA